MTVRADHTALKGPCEHGRYDPHHFDYEMYPAAGYRCPGGTLLPPDTLSPVGMLVYGEFIPYEIWLAHLPFAGPVDAVVALYDLDALAAARTGGLDDDQ